MENPCITVIIPTFRRPLLLKRAIESVLAQSYSHFQIRVYDNASGDETQQIVNELIKKDQRIKYYCHSENIGPWANFQFGLKRVQTPFFAFLSDDDMVFPWFFEKAMNSLEKEQKAAFIAADVIFATEDEVIGHSLRDWNKEGFYNPQDGFKCMLEKMPPIWTAILFRTSLVKDVGDLDVEVGAFFDNDYLFRISAQHCFLILKYPCGVFFQYPSSLSHNYNLNLVWPGWDKMIENVARNKKLSPELQSKAMVTLRNGLEKWLKSLFIYFTKAKKDDELFKLLEISHYSLNSKKLYYFFLVLSKFEKLKRITIVVWDKFRKIKNTIIYLQNKKELKKLENYLKLTR